MDVHRIKKTIQMTKRHFEDVEVDLRVPAYLSYSNLNEGGISVVSFMKVDRNRTVTITFKEPVGCGGKRVKVKVERTTDGHIVEAARAGRDASSEETWEEIVKDAHKYVDGNVIV